MGVSYYPEIDLFGTIQNQIKSKYMSEINLIITRKEELKSLIYQWLDEHPISKLNALNQDPENDRPMSRAELADFLGISTVTVTDWMNLKNQPFPVGLQRNLLGIF